MVSLRPRDVAKIHTGGTERPGPGDIGLVERVGPESVFLYTDTDTLRPVAHEDACCIGYLSIGETYTSRTGESFAGVFYEQVSDGAVQHFDIGIQPQSLSGRWAAKSRGSVLRDALHRLVRIEPIEEIL